MSQNFSKTVPSPCRSNPCKETKAALDDVPQHLAKHHRESLIDTLLLCSEYQGVCLKDAVQDYEKLLESEQAFSMEFNDEFKRNLGKQIKGSISTKDRIFEESRKDFPHLVGAIINAQSYTERQPIVRRALSELRSLLDNHYQLVYMVNKTTRGASSPVSERPTLNRVHQRSQSPPITRDERKKKPIDPLAVSMEATFIPVPRTEYQHMLRLLDSQETEIEELTSRLSRIASDKLTQGNPNIADLSDKNRPTKIGEKFGNLYDDEWSDAFEAIKEVLGDDDNTCIYHLMRIVRYAFKFCQGVAKHQLDRLTHAMKEPVVNVEMSLATSTKNLHLSKSSQESARLQPLAEKYAKMYRKECAMESVRGLQQLFKDTEIKIHFDWAKKRYPDDVNTYIDKCVELIWLMCVQDPPMDLKWPEQNESMNKDLYSFYGKKGKFVELAVWPAVLLHVNGPLVSKGYAQPQ